MADEFKTRNISPGSDEHKKTLKAAYVLASSAMCMGPPSNAIGYLAYAYVVACHQCGLSTDQMSEYLSSCLARLRSHTKETEPVVPTTGAKPKGLN